MQEEIWKDVVGYEGLYQVSNIGNVKSLKYKHSSKIRKLAFHYTRQGYIRVHLTKNKIDKYLLVHRLVAEAFISNPENLPIINHIDGNKSNNIVTNLEWCTHKHNYQHALKMGLLDSRLKKKNFHLKTARHVNQYDLDGNFIKHWDYILDAAKELGIAYSTIYRCCNGQIKKPKLYIWKYAD